MSQEVFSGRHWALLLGVEIPVHGSGQSLKGAVKDVVAIQMFLSTCSPPVKVTALTTQSQSSPNSGDVMPSYNNVIRSLLRIINDANPGDYVYIHFSGHGTRMKDGALALALFDPGPLGSKYLYGSILRSAINRMTTSGMFVTLVLDCCFSGSVLRVDRLQRSDVRYIEYDAAVDDFSDHTNPFASGEQHDTRGAAIALPRGEGPGQRLLDPADYTVLCACGPQEDATELELDNGERRGALSYFLVDSLATLRKRGVRIGYESLHQHLRASFHARYPHQTPMLYGRNGMSFFDNLTLDRPQALVSAYKDTRGSLLLDAGNAHGVQKGDEYALIPLTTSETTPELQRNIEMKVRVTNTQNLVSELQPVEQFDVTRIEDGSTWKAKLLTSLSVHRVGVRLMQSIPSAEQLLEDALTSPFLKLTTEVCQSQDGSPDDDAEERAIYQVMVRDDSTYTVQDERATTLAEFPTLHVHDPGTNQLLLQALGHIAAYKFFERIENRNPDPQFEASFSLTCGDRSPASDGYYKVSHGDTLLVTFKNLDTSTKHLAILGFSSSWEVSNLVFEAGEGHSLPVGPKTPTDSGEQELPLKMEVPLHFLNRNLRQTKDTIKIFVTSKPTLFPAMILPRIEAETVRGDEVHMINSLKELIWGLSVMRGCEEANWSTQTLLVQTTF